MNDRALQLLVQYIERLDNGTAPSCESFLDAHPDEADELRCPLSLLCQVRWELKIPLGPRPLDQKVKAGEEFDGFRIVRELGRGAMGVVYLAREVALERDVALKVLFPQDGMDDRAIQRFEREGRALARLRHPSIVAVYRPGNVGLLRYLAMEYVDGQSLAEILAHLGPGERPIDERLLRAMATIAHAVDYAHGKGVVHRDIKPSNILLDKDWEPRIADFGLAGIADDVELTCSTDQIGTLVYMAPEQASSDFGPVGPAADIRALGAVTYEILTGSRPHRATTREELLACLLSVPPIPPDKLNPRVPRDLAAVVMQALARRQGDRPNAAEFAHAIETWLAAGRSVGPRRRPVLAMTLATVAVLAGFLGWLLGRGPTTEERAIAKPDRAAVPAGVPVAGPEVEGWPPVSSPEPEVWARAVRDLALQQKGDSLPALLTSYTSETAPNLRAWIMWALGEHVIPEDHRDAASAVLLDGLSSGDDALRRVAAAAIHKTSAAQWHEPIQSALRAVVAEDTVAGLVVTEVAAQALVASAAPGSTDALVGFSRGAPYRRRVAFEAAARYPVPELAFDLVAEILSPDGLAQAGSLGLTRLHEAGLPLPLDALLGTPADFSHAIETRASLLHGIGAAVDMVSLLGMLDDPRAHSLLKGAFADNTLPYFVRLEAAVGLAARGNQDAAAFLAGPADFMTTRDVSFAADGVLMEAIALYGLSRAHLAAARHQEAVAALEAAYFRGYRDPRPLRTAPWTRLRDSDDGTWETICSIADAMASNDACNWTSTAPRGGNPLPCFMRDPPSVSGATVRGARIHLDANAGGMVILLGPPGWLEFDYHLPDEPSRIQVQLKYEVGTDQSLPDKSFVAVRPSLNRVPAPIQLLHLPTAGGLSTCTVEFSGVPAGPGHRYVFRLDPEVMLATLRIQLITVLQS